MKKLLLSLLLTFAVSTIVNAQYRGDVKALKDIRDDNPNNQLSWDDDNDVLNWPGVTWENNRVVNLDISGKNINKLPSSIKALEELTDLNVSDNYASDLFIPEICKLTNLISINFNSCHINSIPEEIGNLVNLQKLSIRYNYLSKLPKSISNLKQLQELNLYSNSGRDNNPLVIGSEIGGIVNLRKLNLSRTGLKDIPREIGALNKLEELELYKNNISVLPIQIGELISLKHLNLQNNDLRTIPSQIGKLSNLTDLYLNNNFIKSLPNEIVNVGSSSSYCYINVGNNQISTLPTNIPSRIYFGVGNNKLPYSQLAKIESLNDYGGQTFSRVFVQMKDGKATIDFSSEEVVKNTISSYKWFKNNVEVAGETKSKLNVTEKGKYSVQITNTSYPSMDMFVTVTVVLLNTNDIAALKKIRDANPENTLNWIDGQEATWYGILWNSDGRVSSFYPSKRNLTVIPDAIGDLTEVTTIWIDKNRIETISDEISKLDKLWIFDVSNNKLKTVPNISTSIDLEEINISNNEISVLPIYFGDFEEVYDLRISNNKFLSIPTEISNMSALETFYASDNKISEIPETFSSLSELIYLDLSNNLISELKLDIVSLTNLNTLYLDNNNLSTYGFNKNEASTNLRISVRGNHLPFSELEKIEPSYYIRAGDAEYSIYGWDSQTYPDVYLDEGNLPIQLDQSSEYYIKYSQSEFTWLKDGIELKKGSGIEFSKQIATEKAEYDVKITNSYFYNLTMEVTYHFTSPAENDVLVLKELRDANADNTLNWVDGAENSWEGVKWSNGRVVELNISNKSIEFVPSNISQLSELKKFNLSNNHILFSELIKVQTLDEFVYIGQTYADDFIKIVDSPVIIDFSSEEIIKDVNSAYLWFDENGYEIDNYISTYTVSSSGIFIVNITNTLFPDLTIVVNTHVSGFVINDEDVKVLKQIRDLNANNTLGWIDGSEKTWSGVTYTNGKVSAININNKEIEVLPSDLNKLDKLNSIDVSNNHILFSQLSNIPTAVSTLYLGQTFKEEQATLTGGSYIIDYSSEAIINQVNSSFSWYNELGDLVSSSGGTYSVNQVGKYTVKITNTEYTDLELSITTDVSATLSNDEINESKYVVYPSPSAEFIRLSGVENSADVEIYSISGILMFKDTVKSNQQINISTLESGVYFFKIEGTDEFVKFIKK